MKVGNRDGRCVMSNFGSVFEAAHIYAHKNISVPGSLGFSFTNLGDVKNGIFLKSDIHTLFDRLHIAVFPVVGSVTFRFCIAHLILGH